MMISDPFKTFSFADLVLKPPFLFMPARYFSFNEQKTKLPLMLFQVLEKF